MESFNNESELVFKVNQWCIEKLEKYKAQSMFIPAGNTPVPIYKSWEDLQPEWLLRMDLLQVDDVYSGIRKGMFQQFFKDHLPSYCEVIQAPTSSGGRHADLAILGVGKNGHVAFHEPGLAESFFYGVIDLSTETKKNLDLEDSAKGVTYGVGAFMQAKAILMVISGSGKNKIAQDFLNGVSDRPVGYLSNHPDLTVVIEQNIVDNIQIQNTEQLRRVSL